MLLPGRSLPWGGDEGGGRIGEVFLRVYSWIPRVGSCITETFGDMNLNYSKISFEKLLSCLTCPCI